jgi:hypothetical protein
MIPLTERARIYRSVADPSQGPNARSDQQIYADIPCQIVPISSHTLPGQYFQESTHVIWVPRWLSLLKEDEIRSGRRTDPFADVEYYVYVIDGRPRFKIGLPHREYYASERD